MYGVPPPLDIEDRMKMIEEIFGDDVPPRDVIYNALQNSYWNIQSAIDFLIPPKRQRLQFTPFESNCIKRMGQHAKLIGDPSLDYVQYFVACERNYFDALAFLYETNDIDSALIPENEAKVDQESGLLPIVSKPSETKDEPPLKEVSVMKFGCECDYKSALGNLILSKECFDKFPFKMAKESNVVNGTKFVCIHTEDFANNDTVNNHRIARLSKYCNENHQSLNAMIILVDHFQSYNLFGKGLLKFIYHSFEEKEIFDNL